MTIGNLIEGKTEEAVLTRRNIIRYLVLSQVFNLAQIYSSRYVKVLVYRDVSMRVRRRFPNIDAIIKAGKHYDLLHFTDIYGYFICPKPYL